jgi:hypothetical protein
MVLAVEFTLAGTRFHGLNGGPHRPGAPPSDLTKPTDGK